MFGDGHGLRGSQFQEARVVSTYTTSTEDAFYFIISKWLLSPWMILNSSSSAE
jgi:hypothetical protein